MWEIEKENATNLVFNYKNQISLPRMITPQSFEHILRFKQRAIIEEEIA
jgi:hypothetical protein